MSEHRATIRWKQSGDFLAGKYSREHTWEFDGGMTVAASPAPVNVPAPYSKAENVDPEEAYVAAISSCHMLVFLWLASRAGFEAESYEDEAVGVMTKNERGRLWVSGVTLNTKIGWGERKPSAEELEKLHHEAHEQCFIANSIRTEVRVVSRE